MNLEFHLSRSILFGKNCYLFVCFNRNEQHQILRLKEIDEIRRTMVGFISRELRTPLNGITILLNCAKYITDLPKGFNEKYLKPANSCSEYLKFLINDLVDYTEMNFNKDLRLVFEEVNIRNLINEIDDLLHMKAKMRKVALLFEIDPDNPETIWTDPRRLK
jgi:signal transduction histidine kinase